MGDMYLYGVVREPSVVNPGISGLDGSGAVYTVAHDGLGCLVSDYDGVEFGGPGKEQLVRNLLAHQRALEEAMRNQTVLPMKFGTILNGQHEVVALLAQGRSQFLAALESIEGKVQVEVAATWDVGETLRKISQEDEVVCARQAAAQNGGPTFEQRLQLGRMVNGLLEQRRSGYRKLILACLEPLALAVAPNALISDELVVNLALLIERGRLEEFGVVLDELDRSVGAEINFRVLSPLPPYSFCTVEIARVTRDQVDEARRTLGLPDPFSEAEIRRAYRRLAAGMQSKPGLVDPSTNARFRHLRRTAELLVRYCEQQGRAPNDGPDGPRDPSDGVVTFLIGIAGSGGDEVEATRFAGPVATEPWR